MDKRFFSKFVKGLALSIFVLFLTACGKGDDSAQNNNQRHSNLDVLQVVSSFSILTDMIEEIGGEQITIHNLVPIGTDPHEYEPLPEDIKAATDADLLFYNGLNLEGGENGWFFKMVRSVNQPLENVFEAAEGIQPKYLADEAGNEEVNPHAFISPKAGMQMVENIKDALTDHVPEQADYFEKNAAQYLEKLQQLDKDYAEKLGSIPEDDRIFIASEQAFQYMTDEYGLKEGYIWAIDTEENGTPEQIKRTIEFVRSNQPKYLFVESNVDTRPMKTVSAETGVEIYERPVMSDEIGKPGEAGDSYLNYLEYNLDVIYSALSD